jgi:hypothetical protein
VAYEAQRAREELTEAEREELQVQKRRAEGTPCTVENFEAWLAEFDREMRQQTKRRGAPGADDTAKGTKKKDNKSKDVDKAGRLTGYEQFAGKMSNLEALEAAAEEAEREYDINIPTDEVDEELFEDDVDLDELNFDDDEDGDDEELDI